MYWPLIDRHGKKAGTPAGYQADSGLDIACPVGTTIIAPVDGQILYSEGLAPGKWDDHTPWGPPDHPADTPGCILFRPLKPIIYEGVPRPLLWFAHCSKLAYLVPDGATPRPVKAGQVLGETGKGNDNAHLHLGVLTNRAQRAGDYLPPAQVLHLLHTQAITVPAATPKPAPALATPKPLFPGVSVMFRGKAIATGENHFGATWAPLRPIIEALGYSLRWDAKACSAVIELKN